MVEVKKYEGGIFSIESNDNLDILGQGKSKNQPTKSLENPLNIAEKESFAENSIDLAELFQILAKRNYIIEEKNQNRVWEITNYINEKYPTFSQIIRYESQKKDYHIINYY